MLGNQHGFLFIVGKSRQQIKIWNPFDTNHEDFINSEDQNLCNFQPMIMVSVVFFTMDYSGSGTVSRMG